VSTHFLEFARALRQRARLEPLIFLQVAVDAANLPTYQVEEGIANSSLAHHVAARLGVTRGELEALVARRQKEFVAASPVARAPDPKRSARTTPLGAADDAAEVLVRQPAHSPRTSP
jgi:DNA mismatch repair ATPase MutS